MTMTKLLLGPSALRWWMQLLPRGLRRGPAHGVCLVRCLAACAALGLADAAHAQPEPPRVEADAMAMASASASAPTRMALANKPPMAHKAALGMSAAFAPSGELWAVMRDASGRLIVLTRAGDALPWSAPRVLDTGADAMAADGENRPKIAFGPKGLVAISYTQPLAQPYTGQIRLLRSSDGGRSFSPPVTVHSDRQIITHRFESIAFDARGVLHTVWIDKRDLVLAKKGSYRGAAIYRNESPDGGHTFGPDIKLADHSCECCRIALSPTLDGGMAAMWRHVFAPNERDHAFALLTGEAASARAAAPGAKAAPAPEPQRASLDRWALDACPHHGPGLAPAARGGYHALWFGQREGVMAVRYGRLSAQGQPEGPVQALPDARAEHADVLSAGRRVAIVWRSFDGTATRWRAWVSGDDGASFALKELGQSTEANDHPRLARRGEQLFALWRTAEGVRVERL